MIITKEGTIVIAVGDVFVYDGRVYGCAVYSSEVSGACERCVFHENSRLCKIMECRSNRRGDGLCVLFKLFGEMEGGDDERK